ncbi:RNA-directed DNA polymerase [Streptomyces sp. 4N509B]|uniref:RNA-directed DNA polymerase n=1 Tax=Streptomyces sp. 4N509B TaxID=3457413 RepID=UPI003FD5DAD6
MTSHPRSHTLMPLLTNVTHLKRAARQCMGRAGAPGADHVSWRAYRERLDDNLHALARALRDGSWTPSPPRTVSWTGWGKRLTVVVPVVEDRIVHRALRNAAEPVLERDAYPPWLYGWRPRAGRPHAVAAAAAHLAAGRPWVVDIDIAAATAGAELDATVDGVAVHIQDGTYLRLLRRALAALPTPLTPGSGLTPMLTNLRLVPVDAQLHHLAVVRLTDNYTVFSPTPTAAADAWDLLVAALAEHALAPNRAKSRIWRPNPEDLYAAG